KYSNHPIAKAFMSEFAEYENKDKAAENIKEEKGYGMTADHDGNNIALGNEKLMERLGIKCDDVNESGTVVHIGYGGKYYGYIVFSDIIKENAKKAVCALEDIGISETVMLTGDKRKTAEDVGEKIGIKKIYSELLPEDKVKRLEEIMNGNEKQTIFVGDGINDAPVIAIADVGAAMGGLGSDAAIEAADVVIMNDDVEKIAEAVKISKNTMKIIKENIVFVVAVKLIVLLLAAVGIASMWLAVFADVGVALIAIFNSMRKKY
ncbi:MAG: HAD-IC family P-type ATPase, partial [Firmicutes bacterium]|nr:HAD-IC family P-type ATPase [Bacillota bacterium]